MISTAMFTFTNNTFVYSKTNSVDPNCKTGSSTGYYGWNPNTSIMTVFIVSDTTAVDPTDSCSIYTGIKWKPVSGGLEVSFPGGEDDDFLAPKIVTP